MRAKNRKYDWRSTKDGGSGKEGVNQRRVLSIMREAELSKDDPERAGATVAYSDNGGDRCAMEGIEKGGASQQWKEQEGLGSHTSSAD